MTANNTNSKETDLTIRSDARASDPDPFPVKDPVTIDYNEPQERERLRAVARQALAAEAASLGEVD